MADWTPTDEGMPPEGVVVDALAPDGRHLRLKWEGRLWRFADGSPYLFFTPTYWRPTADAGRDLGVHGKLEIGMSR